MMELLFLAGDEIIFSPRSLFTHIFNHKINIIQILLRF